MGRCRFVTPEVVRLQLADSDWIDVKKRLTVGEERAAFQQIVGEVNTQGWRRPNMEMMGIAEMAAYIVQWSLVDAAGKPVPVSVGAIQSMHSSSFDEISAAIATHVAAMDVEEQQRKNSDGEIKSATISQPVA